MTTSNNGHQLNESSNYPPTFTDTYVQLSLDSPPFGFVMQLTPQRLWFVHRASPISSLFCHGPNISYPIYTPIVGMSGFYHLVGIMRNLVPGESAGRFSDLLSFFNEIDNNQGGHEPLVHLNLPPIRTRDHITRHVSDNDHSPLVPAAEVTLNEETLDSELNNLASDSDLTYEGYLELEERMGRVGSRLSEETIMQHIRLTCYTTTTTSTNEGPDICVICQGEFEDDEFMGGLRCGHEYHVQCIKKWLRQINNCPICKATAVL